MAKRTYAQVERQRNEHRSNGRYAKVNPCCRCGESAGADPYGDRRTDNIINDEAICLCVDCVNLMDKLTDEQLIAEINRPEYGKLPRGKP